MNVLCASEGSAAVGSPAPKGGLSRKPGERPSHWGMSESTYYWLCSSAKRALSVQSRSSRIDF